DIDAFVQDLRRGEREHFARVKRFEPLAPLFHARLMRDRRNEKLFREAIDHLVLGRKDQSALAPMALQQLCKHAQLAVCAERDALRLTIGEQRASPLVTARARGDESLPAVKRAQFNSLFLQKAAKDRPLVLVS